MHDNLYKILGLESTATIEEIKTKFKELSKKHHPDIGGDTQTFGRIVEAYTILSDPDSKDFYDKTGFAGNKSRFDKEVNKIIRDTFVSLMKSFGEEALTIDLIDEVDTTINDKINQFKKINEKNEKVSKLINNVKNKIKYKGKKENYISSFLQNEIIALEANNNRINSQIITLKKALLELKNYSYDINNKTTEEKQIKLPYEEFAKQTFGVERYKME